MYNNNLLFIFLVITFLEALVFIIKYYYLILIAMHINNSLVIIEPNIKKNGKLYL